MKKDVFFRFGIDLMNLGPFIKAVGPGKRPELINFISESK